MGHWGTPGRFWIKKWHDWSHLNRITLAAAVRRDNRGMKGRWPLKETTSKIQAWGDSPWTTVKAVQIPNDFPQCVQEHWLMNWIWNSNLNKNSERELLSRQGTDKLWREFWCSWWWPSVFLTSVSYQYVPAPWN